MASVREITAGGGNGNEFGVRVVPVHEPYLLHLKVRARLSRRNRNRLCKVRPVRLPWRDEWARARVVEKHTGCKRKQGCISSSCRRINQRCRFPRRGAARHLRPFSRWSLVAILSASVMIRGSSSPSIFMWDLYTRGMARRLRESCG